VHNRFVAEDRVFVDQKTFARSLRNNATSAEVALWHQLKGSKLGFKFTRQYPIGDRVADFCCRQRRVVIELDGSSHEAKAEDDEVRDRFFQEMGYIVLRMSNLDVSDRMPKVLERIRAACEDRPQWRY
jgi:very-short-patch-repair endonuclease